MGWKILAEGMKISLISALIIGALMVAGVFFAPRSERGTIAVSAPMPSQELPEHIDMAVGGSFALARGRFTETDSDIVDISPDGVLWAREEGECLVTAELPGEEPFQTPVRVFPAPEIVRLFGPGYRMGVGETAALAARAYIMDGSDTVAQFSFLSSNASVASVSAYGDVTAVGTGSAMITATAYNGVSAAIEITVGRSPSRVALSAKELVVGDGETVGLVPSLPAGSAGGVEMTSSDTSVAVVMGEAVYGVAPGTAVVTARTYNGKTDTCAVTVKNAPIGVALDQDMPPLGIGASREAGAALLGRNVSSRLVFTSSDDDVASVDQDGIITGKNPGKCTITATTFNGHTDSTTFTVLPAPSQLDIDPRSVTLGLGEIYTVRPITDPGTAAEFSWRSSDGSVATVSGDGEITAMTRGSTVITLTAHNGLRAKLNVSVRKKPGSLEFSQDSAELCVDETMYLTARLPYGTGAAVEYYAEDPSVIRVDDQGRVTALAPGETDLVARTYNALESRCTVRVCLPAGGIEMDGSLTLTAGVPVRAPVEVRDILGGPFAGEVRIQSADPDIVAVEDGVLLPLQNGSTYLTVTAHELSKRTLVKVEPWGREVSVAAHRGGSDGTENTLVALRSAVAAGVDYVEIDVRRTRDGEIVLMHDESILRTSGVTGRVARMTLEQLRAVNFRGSSICTLDEALDYLKDTGMKVLLELKISGIEKDCVDAVRRAGMEDRVVYISFKISVLDEVRGHDPDARVGYLWSGRLTDPGRFAQENDIDWMLPKYTAVTQEMASRVHAVGALMGSWTANSAATVRTLKSAGTDLVITDRVPTALKVLGR